MVKPNFADFSQISSICFPRFLGSAHVQHLRKHPAKYEAAVVDFLKRTMSTIEEEEVEEEVG